MLTNKAMILSLQKKGRRAIKIEVMFGYRKNEKYKDVLNFRISNGLWVKAQDSDIIVVVDEHSFYIGETARLNEEIRQRLNDQVRFRKGKERGYIIYVQISKKDLEKQGLLESHPIHKISCLETLIRENYENQNT